MRSRPGSSSLTTLLAAIARGSGLGPPTLTNAPDIATLRDSSASATNNTEKVPIDILRAITFVEIGGRLAGNVYPWSWAVNAANGGSGFRAEGAVPVLSTLPVQSLFGDRP